MQTDSLRSPPTIEEVLDALALKQIADDRLDDTLRRWAGRPVRLILSVPGAPYVTPPSPTPVNDVHFIIEVVSAEDAAGEHVQDLGPFTWAASPAASVSSFTDDPAAAGDTSKREVAVAPADASGNQPDFTVTATDPQGVTGSLLCHPIPGGPTRLTLGVV